jgi:putative lipoprotein
MKKKFALRLFTALLFPVIIASCGKEEEQETVQPAADLVIDNSAVTLLQGDEITVSITSGNGDYSVKTFDESVATATIDGDKVTIKATENSVLDENNRAETTILVIDGRKKTARIKVQVAKLWDLTTDIPEEGIELFIGEKKTIEILTGNGDYKITMPEGAERYIKLDELSGQVFSVTAIEETPQGEPVQITITDKKQKTIAILIIVNIVDLTLKSNEATFAEPDAEVQTIEIEKGNGGYTFTFQTGEGEPTSTPTIVEATEEDNFITLRPLARGDVTVIVTDQKGSKEEIAVTVNPYEIKLDGNLTELSLDGFESTKEINISRGNGGYQLAGLTPDNSKYIESASIDGKKLTIKAKWMGETTLTITDDARKTLVLPVKINSMAAKLSSDYCFKIGSKDFFKNSP